MKSRGARPEAASGTSTAGWCSREVPPFRLRAAGVRSTEELEILELAQRRVTVRRLALGRRAGSPSRACAPSTPSSSPASCATRTPPPAPQPVVQTETGMFLLSALQQPPDPSLRDAIRRRCSRSWTHSAPARPRGLAQAGPRRRPADELVRALEEKMERYHALRDGGGRGRPAPDRHRRHPRPRLRRAAPRPPGPAPEPRDGPPTAARRGARRPRRRLALEDARRAAPAGGRRRRTETPRPAARRAAVDRPPADDATRRGARRPTPLPRAPPSTTRCARPRRARAASRAGRRSSTS